MLSSLLCHSCTAPATQVEVRNYAPPPPPPVYSAPQPPVYAPPPQPVYTPPPQPVYAPPPQPVYAPPPQSVQQQQQQQHTVGVGLSLERSDFVSLPGLPGFTSCFRVTHNSIQIPLMFCSLAAA